LQAKPQVPPAHVAVALVGSLHTVVQSPHALTLLSVFVSHPSLGSLLQSPKPGSHAPIWHDPATHEPVALSYAVVQLFPHVPQFVSVLNDASHPSLVSLLQSAHPLSHEPISQPAAPQ
jgi:hypothetical protein